MTDVWVRVRCGTTFISKPSDRLALYGRYSRTAAPIPDVGYRRGSPISADGSTSIAVDLGKWRQNGYPRHRVAQLTLRPVARCVLAAGCSASGCIGVRHHVGRARAAGHHRSDRCTLWQVHLALARVTVVALRARCHPSARHRTGRFGSPPHSHHQSVTVVGRPQTL